MLYETIAPYAIRLHVGSATKNFRVSWAQPLFADKRQIRSLPAKLLGRLVLETWLAGDENIGFLGFKVYGFGLRVEGS